MFLKLISTPITESYDGVLNAIRILVGGKLFYFIAQRREVSTVCLSHCSHYTTLYTRLFTVLHRTLPLHVFTDITECLIVVVSHSHFLRVFIRFFRFGDSLEAPGKVIR